MVFETNIATINPSNTPHSYLIARMDSAKKTVNQRKSIKQHNSSVVTGYLIDRYHDVIAYTFRGTPDETDQFLRNFPPSDIYSFSNLSVKQVNNYNYTSSLFSKELNLNKTQIFSIPQNDSNKYNIPTRRPATETVKQIIHRMESKKITHTLADITALIVLTKYSKSLKKRDNTNYNKKQMQLNDGQSIFDLTFVYTDTNDVLEENMTIGNTITFLHAQVKFESNNTKKTKFILDTQIGEIFPDNMSTRAKELLENKYTILSAHTNPSQFNSSNIQYEKINAQQLEKYIRQNCCTKEITEMATETETQKEIKESNQIYEIHNVTVTGLGRSNVHTLTYEGCSICRKTHKNSNTTCSPDTELILHACCPNLEITDWSGTAFNLLAFGQALMTLLNTNSPDQTQRIAEQNPDTLLFQTQTNIRVKLCKNTGQIITAEKRNFSEDLGIISTTLPNNIERTNNIAYALFEDITYENNELTIAQQPTTYIILYTIGCQNPHIINDNETHLIINTVDVCSTYDESFTRIQAQFICHTDNITRNIIHKNEHALLTIDHINFPPKENAKPPLANIIAVQIIANSQNQYTANKSLKQFISEAKSMKNALAYKPTPNSYQNFNKQRRKKTENATKV